MKTFFFDMDGTLNKFFEVENWLDSLEKEKTHPYDVAKPALNMSVLARKLNMLQNQGYHIGIISWGSMKSSDDYLMRVDAAKRKWLKKHLPSVKWDYICITHYGISKYEIARSLTNEECILFDDSENNRIEWGGKAYDEKNILQYLKMEEKL